ncbi:hypothetical protein Btru_062622 [Bulinus truncatus]|nr:hypothetical protein Btru_062622 [Bulinus truncatus]
MPGEEYRLWSRVQTVEQSADCGAECRLWSRVQTVEQTVLMKFVYIDSNRPLILTEKFNQTYDYIVIGAGSAGCVVANRLSEDPGATVLLLEAGEDDWANEKILTPGLAATTWRTSLDWGYSTEPQQGSLKGFNNGSSYWPRGRALGGTSSINGMQYVRGSRHDYDRWAKYTGSEGWDYSHVLPYFKKLEDTQINEIKNSVYRGQGGPVPVNRIKSQPVAKKIVEAAHAAGYPINEDYNGRTMEGVSHSQVNAQNDERWSSSRSYIHPILDRRNLHVAVRSVVQKIIIKDKKTVGVEVIKDGRKYTIGVTKEVILSGGAIGSPQILMLSGIGPKKHLEDLKIPVVSDRPVGENLQDHLFFDLGVTIREPLSSPFDSLKSWSTYLQYKLFGTGFLTSAYQVEVLAFKSTTPETQKIDWPDLEIHFFTFLPRPEDDGFGYTDEVKADMAERDSSVYGFRCLPSLLRPESRGRLTLKSSDPFDPPSIIANYLEKPEDVQLLIRGIEECKKIVSSQPLKDIGAEFTEKSPAKSCAHLPFDTDQYWACVLKLRPLTIYHPVGTCKMGPANDPTAVVDPELRVIGVSGLRVADASVMPWIVSGNTNIPAVMIGEKAADLIRGQRTCNHLFTLSFPGGNNQAPTVSVMVNPPVYYTGLTDQLTVTCQINKDDNNDKVTSVLIKRATPTDPNFQELATLADYVGIHVLQADVQARGVLDNNDARSYLELYWDYPTGDAQGAYMCEVNFLDKGIWPTTVSTQTQVQALAPTIDQLATLIRKMDNGQKALQVLVDDLRGQLTSQVHLLALQTAENNGTIYNLAHELNADKEQYEKLEHSVQNMKQDFIRSETFFQKYKRANAKINLQDAFLRNFSWGGHTYYLSKQLKTTVNESEDICEAFNGYLAEINNYNEFQQIQEFLTKTNDAQYVYVSGTDEGRENHWVLHHSQQVMTFDQWYSSSQGDWKEPNSGPSQNCIMLYRQFDWHMLDTFCHQNSGSLYFLCEIPN